MPLPRTEPRNPAPNVVCAPYSNLMPLRHPQLPKCQKPLCLLAADRRRGRSIIRVPTQSRGDRQRQQPPQA